ncbi:MAG: hypothetical protein ACT4N2_14225 [Hyphomicrobium sp.]
MLNALLKSTALVAVLSTSVAFTGTVAEAKGGKEYFSQTYRFNQAMKGVEGRQGDHYCSYRNTPIRKCDANGRCKVVGYELFQHCY